MKKLIVNSRQAREIRDANGAFSLQKIFRLKRNSLSSKEHLNKQFPKGDKFWVAEPLNSIAKDGERKDKYAADQTPEGWRVCTVNRPGSRVHFGEHRHIVAVIGHTVTWEHEFGDFVAFIEFIKVEK